MWLSGSRNAAAPITRLRRRPLLQKTRARPTRRACNHGRSTGTLFHDTILVVLAALLTRHLRFAVRKRRSLNVGTHLCTAEISDLAPHEPQTQSVRTQSNVREDAPPILRHELFEGPAIDMFEEVIELLPDETCSGSTLLPRLTAERTVDRVTVRGELLRRDHLRDGAGAGLQRDLASVGIETILAVGVSGCFRRIRSASAARATSRSSSVTTIEFFLFRRCQ